MTAVLNFLGGLFGLAMMLAFFAYALFGIAAAGEQIQSLSGLGEFLSYSLGAMSFMIPPLGLGFTFFGAKDVWGWEWWQALLFTFPGLIFMFLSVFGNLFSWFFSLFDRRR